MDFVGVEDAARRQGRGEVGDGSWTDSWEQSRLPSHMGGVPALGLVVEHPPSEWEGGGLGGA